MTLLNALWLPILLAAVAVFVVSSLIDMALGWWHRSDYTSVPQEDAVMAALRPVAPPPGDYMIPGCSTMDEMRSPAFKAKLLAGPVVIMTVKPNGPINIGKSMLGWFIYSLVISAFAAGVAVHAVSIGGALSTVFWFAAVTAFLGYSGALWQMSIWYQRSIVTTIKSSVDGAVYAAVTGIVIAWFWPR